MSTPTDSHHPDAPDDDANTAGRVPDRSPTRRTLLVGSAAAAATAVAGVSAPAAAAPRVRPWRRTRIPGRFERHLMNRMGFGYTPGTWAQMRRTGGPLQWFDAQLRPARVREARKVRALDGWYPDLGDQPAVRWNKQRTGVKAGWEYARDLENLTILRRIYTRRPVQEMMTDFWAHHLHVPAVDDLGWVYRHDYEQLLRRHALGRFDELLFAATTHPAMLLYLDTWAGKPGRPTENHGRELLELHTVGRAAGYTEAMVKDSAKILSGHTVDAFDSWRPSYDPDRHVTGPVQVLGFSHPNRSADGREVTRAYLRYLAHHPATARTVAHKLAVKFVSDRPSRALVRHLARVYRRHDTAIAPVLRALVRHKEFRRSAGKKVRTPHEDMIATMRVLRVEAKRPGGRSSTGDFGHAIAWHHGGLNLYHWPRPDGAPITNPPYASASRMLASFRMHWAQAGGYYPTRRVAYKPARYWFPARSLRFDQLVDHLCRTFLGRRSTRRLLQAAVQATGIRPGTRVDHDHPVGGWLGVRLIAVLLDSPEHMQR